MVIWSNFPASTAAGKYFECKGVGGIGMTDIASSGLIYSERL